MSDEQKAGSRSMREDAFRRMLTVFGFDPEVTMQPGDRFRGVIAVFAWRTGAIHF